MAAGAGAWLRGARGGDCVRGRVRRPAGGRTREVMARRSGQALSPRLLTLLVNPYSFLVAGLWNRPLTFRFGADILTLRYACRACALGIASSVQLRPPFLAMSRYRFVSTV